MSILELRETYNGLIAREKKAEKFFDNPNVEQSKKDNWIPEFMKITEGLSILMIKHREITGVEMNDDEVLNGF
jgi:hypothetical protein